MKQGFVKVAAVTPKIVVADTKENTALICAEIKKAEQAGAKIIVLPELCITGYTCSDLFLQEKMLREAKKSLLEIAAFTFALDCIVFVGLPFEYNGKLYNVAAAVSNGKVLGFVPKTYLPNYNEFYEARHFTRGMDETVQVNTELLKCRVHTECCSPVNKPLSLFMPVSMLRSPMCQRRSTTNARR